MSACIPTYMLASSMIDEGMNWWQAMLTIFLGNMIVLAADDRSMPMPAQNMASRSPSIAGRRSVFWEPTFQRCCAPRRLRLVRHSNLDRRLGHLQDPDGLQSIVGCPAELAAASVSTSRSSFASWRSGPINMLVIYKGIESIRILLNIKAPLLIALGLALLAWAYVRAGGFGPMLSQPSAFVPGGEKAGQFWVILLSVADGQRRLLGHAVAEHPRLQPLCLFATRPGAGPGARPADHDGAVFVHRRRGHVAQLSSSMAKPELGSRRRAQQVHQSRRTGRRDGRALRGDAGDEHRSQRRGPCQRLCALMAAARLHSVSAA